MKKMKKYFPLIVGLVILLSVAAYGTRAYFSDSANLESNIELTLGDVNVNSSSESGWKYMPLLNEENDQLKDKDGNPINIESKLTSAENITVARPGDTFSKEFTFENTGTLDQDITFVTDKNTKNGYQTGSIFSVTWVYKDKDGVEVATPFLLKPEATVTATMKVSIINPGFENGKFEVGTFNNADFNEKDFVGETVTVQAVQTNGTFGQ